MKTALILNRACLWAAFIKVILAAACVAVLAAPQANAQVTLRPASDPDAEPIAETVNTEALKTHLESFHRSSELAAEIDARIRELDKNTPVKIRIDLDLWKLRALADVSDTQATSDFAYKIYETYERGDYASDGQYGDTMQQIVQAVAKTDQLDLAFEIIETLRESVYQTPNSYLSFIIDKSLMEIYIETFDYKRALAVELSILENEDYMSIDVVRAWRPSLYNEIAFIYNRLGDGEKALEYLALALEGVETQGFLPSDLLKARALNAGNRGRAYLLIGRYDEVQPLGQLAMKAGEELQQNYLIALGYRLLGSAAYHQGDYEKALPMLEEGITLAELHGIATLRKYLYNDYALCLEALGRYEASLFWQKKQISVEMIAQEQAANARDALNNAEFNALESHQKIVRLERENIDQRKIADRDRRIKKLLVVTVLSLLTGGGFLACLICYMRKAQRTLIKSEKNAQAANKAKGEFLANMSHEIRTPMNGVLGMAQVLEKTPLSEKQRLYIDMMKHSGETLLFILNDILDFSKLEAHKLTLNLESGDLDQTLQEVVALLTPSAKDGSIELRYDFDPSLPKYYIFDECRMRQILTNVLGNAVKFTKKGYVHLHVSGEFQDGTVLIQIQVTDTGIGIEQEKLAMIFEEFTQAESSTTRAYGGTGLGLSIARRLSKIMKGTLSATSTFGEGSVFTLKLPLDIAEITTDPTGSGALPCKTHVIPMPTAENPLLLAPQTSLETSNDVPVLNILIAEDDPIQFAVIQRFLTHPRIKLTLAENGAEAVEAYRSSKFNMIFMDMSMPIMDGVSATKAIREIEHKDVRQRTPIICLSAHAMVWQEERFSGTEIDAYLSKPVDKEKLYAGMQNWLKPRNAAA